MEYSVVVNNKFALFDSEDEDPLEVLQRSEEEAARKAKTAAVKENTAVSKSKVATKNAKNTAKTTKPDAKQPAKVLAPVQDQKVKPPATNQVPRRENVAEKPPRFRQNENTQQQQRRPPRDENRDQPRTDTEFRPDRTEQRGEEFHGRGGGYRRGGRGGQGRGGANEGGFDRFGKRDFERHSGSDRTGLKPIEKREGGGAHNWGTIADAVAEQELLAANATATQEQRTDVETTPTGEEQPAVDAEVTEAEDEKQLTLDEWKAMQERERAKPAFNIRKPGEGCQTAPEWKKMVVLKKKVNDEDQDEEEEEEEEDDDEDHSRQKQTVPIQIRFNDTATRGGAGFRGRGGRGRGGRRPAGDGGAERPRNSAAGKTEAVPNVDNEFDFPSLA